MSKRFPEPKSTLFRAIREHRGLTQETLAAKTNVAVSTIQRLEKGDHAPTHVTLGLLSRALETSSASFFSKPELLDFLESHEPFGDDDSKENEETGPEDRARIGTSRLPRLSPLVPLLSFVKITDEGNPYGYDRIDVVAFNYDNRGSALALSDGQFDSYAECDISTIMFGHPGTGDRYYELAAVIE